MGAFSLKNHPLYLVFFIALIFLTLLGDGERSGVDVAGAAAALIVSFWVAITQKEARRFPDRLAFVWAAFLVYVLAITPFSADIGLSLRAVARYMDAFLLYYVFYVYTRPGEEKVFTAFLAGFGVVVLVLAFLISVVPALRPLLPFMNLLWSWDGHNHTSDLLLFLIPVALVFFRHSTQLRYVVVAFVLAALFLFRARIALVTAAVSSAVFLSLLFKKKTTRVGAGVIVLVLMVSVAAAALIPRLSADLRPTKSSLTARVEYWRQAALAIGEKPLFGFGPGTFPLLSPRFQSGPNRASWFAHSFLLETVAEIGVAGAGLLLWVLLSACIKPAISIWKTKPFTLGRAALAGSLCILLFYSMVDYSLNFFVLWALFWAVSGAIAYEA